MLLPEWCTSQPLAYLHMNSWLSIALLNCSCTNYIDTTITSRMKQKGARGGLQLHYQIPPFSKLYNFSYRTWRYDFQSYDRQRQRQQESQEIATLLLPPHQHIQTVSHLLWSYIYNFVLAGAYIRSRASTCSQPTIGLQSQVANAPNMLDTSPWREKRSSTKLGEMKYLRVLPSPWLPSHDHCGASKNYCSAVVHTWLVPHKSTSGNGIFQ